MVFLQRRNRKKQETMKNYAIPQWGYALIVTLLGMTCMASCGDDKEETPPPQGTIKIAFYVKGVVTDQDGNPLQGIAMKAKEDYMNKLIGFMMLDSVVTDSEGAYRTRIIRDADIHDGQVLMAEDLNGVFRSDTVALGDLPRRKVAEGDDERDAGTWEIDGNARLTKKGD